MAGVGAAEAWMLHALLLMLLLLLKLRLLMYRLREMYKRIREIMAGKAASVRWHGG
jgi:hypothetical protein